MFGHKRFRVKKRNRGLDVVIDGSRGRRWSLGFPDFDVRSKRVGDEVRVYVGTRKNKREVKTGERGR